jgi:hypothetical protein
MPELSQVGTPARPLRRRRVRVTAGIPRTSRASTSLGRRGSLLRTPPRPYISRAPLFAGRSALAGGSADARPGSSPIAWKERSRRQLGGRARRQFSYRVGGALSVAPPRERSSTAPLSCRWSAVTGSCVDFQFLTTLRLAGMGDARCSGARRTRRRSDRGQAHRSSHQQHPGETSLHAVEGVLAATRRQRLVASPPMT